MFFNQGEFHPFFMGGLLNNLKSINLRGIYLILSKPSVEIVLQSIDCIEFGFM